MRSTKNFLHHDVHREIRADGVVLLSSNLPLGEYVSSTGDWVNHWATTAPSRTFLAERSGKGWREVSFLSTRQKVRSIASALLARGLNAQSPVLVMSGNGIDHGLLALAAQYVGIPVVPVAEQYSLLPGAHGRLVEVIEMTRPGLAYVVDANKFAEALRVPALDGIEVVASQGIRTGVTAFDDLTKSETSADVDAAFAAVGPETVAKILLTSGSTSSPKGVLTTHKMLCVNQAQLADALPFLRQRPHTIVDWLPWNHVFGGSHNFNMMLAGGGSLYIDDGKPHKSLFARTAENLALMTGTLVFNVPVGFAMLLELLRKDAGLRERFFADLDMLYYAGASLPQEVWSGFEQMAMDVKGEVPLITSSWGLTETAPAVLTQQEPTERSGVVGVPMAGITLKLIPEEGERFEVRAMGPNVMPGYFEAPDKTRDAFDNEGYFITGDAMAFVDATNPNLGLRFEGRISENFKLLTGTWVRAASLRLDLLAHLAPLASDLVIVGQDRHELGILVVPNDEALREYGDEATSKNDILSCPPFDGQLAERLSTWCESHTASSTRVARAIVMAESPSLADGEITAKGNLNFRKIISRRGDPVERLFDDDDFVTIRV